MGAENERGSRRRCCVLSQSVNVVLIRTALPSDVPQIADVNVRSWQAAYRGHMPDSFLDALDPVQRAAWWAQVVVDPEVTVLVAVEAGQLVGFSSFLACRDDDAAPATCEIATLYVDPRHWRSGCGASLVEAVVRIARQGASREISLWVLGTNVAARAFYESLGFAHDGRSKTDSRLGLVLHEVRYRRQLPEI